MIAEITIVSVCVYQVVCTRVHSTEIAAPPWSTFLIEGSFKTLLSSNGWNLLKSTNALYFTPLKT